MPNRSTAIFLMAPMYAVVFITIGIWPTSGGPLRDLMPAGMAAFAMGAALFVPLGSLAAAFLPRSRWWWAAIFGLVVSLAFEGLQGPVLASRTSSARDLLAGLIGAGVGGALSLLPRPRPTTDEDRPIRVLSDVPRSAWVNNPYISTLMDRLEPEVDVFGFNPHLALSGAYDLAHVHWPEHRLLGRSRREHHERTVWFLRWLWTLHRHDIPVVWTRHNLRPHDRPPLADRVLLRFLSFHSRARVWLSESSMQACGVRQSASDVLILHGDYQPWINELELSEKIRPAAPPVRLVCVGAIKPYKSFVEAAASTPTDGDFALTIAGPASDEDYLATLTSVSAGLPNVEVVPGRLDDVELAELVRSASAVLVPYKALHNSGVVFLALSLARPVIMSDGKAARELLAEYGSSWIGLYDALGPAGLRRAWESVASTRGTPLPSPRRDWSVIVQAHVALFRTVAMAGTANHRTDRLQR